MLRQSGILPDLLAKILEFLISVLVSVAK